MRESTEHAERFGGARQIVAFATRRRDAERGELNLFKRTTPSSLGGDFFRLRNSAATLDPPYVETVKPVDDK